MPPPLRDWNGNDLLPGLLFFLCDGLFVDPCVEPKTLGKRVLMRGLQAGRQPQTMPMEVSIAMIT